MKFTCPTGPDDRLIPLEALDLTAIVEGTLTVEEVSEADARHMAAESGQPEKAAQIVGPQRQLRMASPAMKIEGLSKQGRWREACAFGAALVSAGVPWSTPASLFQEQSGTTGTSEASMRVLSGIQSSGVLHLGNYFGAMKQHIEHQERHECFFFIANYHSLNTVQDAGRLTELTRDVALDYLAMGLDPNKATLFRQSDVPEVCELAWILGTVTTKGLLDRATSYKDKIAKGITPSVGLYFYPALMAADILIYRSDLVPVGKDQVQHIEFTQDMAGYFNNTYREVFVRPEPKLNEAAIVPGIDGQKMSKSYGNAIDLFGEPKPTRKRIMSIKTDSTPVEDPKDPEACNVFALLRLMASAEETDDWRRRYREGGMGYGEAKNRLAELCEETFGPARERRAELASRPDEVEDILRSGGQRARSVAREVMADVRDACGVVTAAG